TYRARGTRVVPYASYPCTDPARTTIPTLSLHDALPISQPHLAGDLHRGFQVGLQYGVGQVGGADEPPGVHIDAGEGLGMVDDDVDRKSTRLNSSHVQISYAVFCLKKKKTTRAERHLT